MSRAMPATRRGRRALALSAVGLAALTSVAGAALRQPEPNASVRVIDEWVPLPQPCTTLPPLRLGEPARKICPPAQWGMRIDGSGFLPGEDVRVTTELGGEAFGTGMTTRASRGHLGCVVRWAVPPCIMDMVGGGDFSATGGRHVFAASSFYSGFEVTVRAVGLTSGRDAVRVLPILYLE